MTPSFLVILFVTVAAEQLHSFSFEKFDEESNLKSQIALLGDAMVINGSSCIQITRSSVYSFGRVIYKKPLKLFERKPKSYVSFSTSFSFSLSPSNNSALAFLLIPNGYASNVFDWVSLGMSPELNESKHRPFAVEFHAKDDDKFTDLHKNDDGIHASSLISVRVSNLSSSYMILSHREKLRAWIDYDAGSKRVEVRLSNSSDSRPSDPLIAYSIDFRKLWKDEELFVGLGLISGNSSRTTVLYSWSFNVRQVPHWMHSQPVDPKAISEKTKPMTGHKISDCLSRVLSALILAFGCGAFGAFIVLFVWTIFGGNRPVVPEEFTVHPVEYKKIKVIVDKASQDVKN